MDLPKPHVRRIEYTRKLFSMKQVRDCVSGSDAIKRAGEMYLPMPSGMSLVNSSPASSNRTSSSSPLADRSLTINQAPWYHANPAYSAYVHRAKFPDMTGNTLRGLVGVATREDPEVELPAAIAYLEELATVDGEDLASLYEYCVSELLQVARHALVLDIRDDSTFFIARYASETIINWKVSVINGRRMLSYIEFETISVDDEGGEQKCSLVYRLERDENEHLVCMTYHFTDGVLDKEPAAVIYKGTTLDFLPVVVLGVEDNTPEPDAIPLLGISDCALDIYRHSADLNNAHFMTCNPTLVFIGVDADDAPITIGSTIAICLPSAESDAKYVQTDANGLDHVKDYIQDVFGEAMQYGASLIGPTKRAAESAEALSLRQSASGATLITIVARAGAGIEQILNMAATLVGSSGEAEFTPNYEFAEVTLSAQEILALMNLWMNGGISRDTLLTNLSRAGRLGDKTPDEEAGLIDDEGVLTGGGPGQEDEDDADTND